MFNEFNSKPIKVYLLKPTDENTIDSKQFDFSGPSSITSDNT